MPCPFDLASMAFPDESEVTRLVSECADMACLKYSDGEFLVRAGEPRQDVYLILKGSCLVQRDGATSSHRSGDELAIIEARPELPVFVGETAYLADTPRTASVRAAMNVWALHMTPAHLDLIIERFPGLTRTLCRQFATRLKESNAALARLREASAMAVETQVLNPGDRVFQVGDAVEALYLLIDGVVRLEGPEGAVEMRPSPADPSFLNAVPYLRRAPETHTAYAVSACVLNAIAPDNREAVLRNFPALFEALL